MREFKDKDNNRWEIDLSIGTVMRVKGESRQRFNLFEPQGKCGEKTLLDAVCDDLPTFWEMLWLLVRPSAEAKSIDADKFGLLMAADCLVTAHAAFMEEWRDFFQNLQHPDKALALEKTAKYREAARKLLLTKLSDPAILELDERVALTTKRAASKWLGDLQASLDKTLDPLPSDSSG